jgi:hypothetical protein
VLDFPSIAGNVASLVWVAARSFAGTVLVLLSTGILLACVSYYFLSDFPLYALIAVVVTLAESLTAGIVLGSKRAFIVALAYGLGLLRLGAFAVRMLFDRLLGVSADQQFGERGGWTARRLERIPLAQVERRLNQVVRDLVNAPDTGAGISGWIRGRIERTLLRLVARYTLARFRAEDVERGGIDLVKMQADLEAQIDDLLIAKLRRGLNLWTILVILGLPITVCAQTYIAFALLQAK